MPHFRFLLDTHAFLWLQLNDGRLPSRLRQTLADESNDLFVSSATCWEIATKYRIGKLRIPRELAQNVESAAIEAGMLRLSISFRHAQQSGALPAFHSDPFDRILIAQALSEKLTMVSNEKLFDDYGVERVWS